MIKVNMLPPEYRVKERTPLPMMLGILGGVVVTALVVVSFLYLRLHKFPDILRTLRDKEQTRTFYIKKAKIFDGLVAEKAKLDKLDQAVNQLKSRRYPWTKAVDDLSWKVVKANRHEKNVKAWFEKIDFGFPKRPRTPRGRQGPQSGEIKLDLVVAGKDYDHIPVFLEIMLDRSGWLGNNIMDMPLPNIKPKDYKDYVPDVGLASSLTITLAPEPVMEKAPTEEKKGKGTGDAPSGTSNDKKGK